MPDDTTAATIASESPSNDTAALPSGLARNPADRIAVMAFVVESETERALRDCLRDANVETFAIHRGGIRGAIMAMQNQASAKLLIVDVSQEEQPLTALGDLSHMVEPDVRVLVIGNINHVDFYREVTRGLGAVDYIEVPLTRDRVSQCVIAALGSDSSRSSGSIIRGRTITITGVRGGVGATTLAVNLAWNLGVQMRRHTVLLDSDIHFGSASLLLNIHSSPGFWMALETPERIDTLLAERVAQTAADRLHVLAGHEKVSEQITPAPGAANVLLNALRQRYNLILADVPFRPMQFNRDLLDLADQRVLVMSPSLSAVHDTLRMLDLPAGDRQSQSPIVVLNRLGIAGGLTLAQVETALKRPVDVAIADLPREVGHAATVGRPAMQSCRRFGDSILELTKKVTDTHIFNAAQSGIGTHSHGRRRGWRLFRNATNERPNRTR